MHALNLLSLVAVVLAITVGASPIEHANGLALRSGECICPPALPGRELSTGLLARDGECICPPEQLPARQLAADVGIRNDECKCHQGDVCARMFKVVNGREVDC